jgi:predicted metalloprotease
MKWEGRRQSSNVDDRRGMSTGRGKTVVGGGIGLVIALVIFLLTGNPGALQDITGTQQTQPESIQQEYVASESEKQLMDYASVVMADIEDTWNGLLPQYDEKYQEPTLVVYDQSVNSGCGAADAGIGPFYCTQDQTIYLDLSFYDTLVERYGAKQGDFIMSYVIAHEAGHHVQTLLGVTDQLNTLREQAASGAMSETEFNTYSVRYELQADYLAGVVARHIKEKGYLEQGDLNEAMSAAAAVGDDTIQKKIQGYADPDTFNHGTSLQRQTWFMKGYDAGDLSGWDTFQGSI